MLRTPILYFLLCQTANAVECPLLYDRLVEPYLAVTEAQGLYSGAIKLILEHEQYKQAAAIRIKLLHRLQQSETAPLLESLARRMRTSEGNIDERVVSRWLERAETETGIRVNQEQADFITAAMQIESARARKKGLSPTAEGLRNRLREDALTDLNNYIQRAYEEQANLVAIARTTAAARTSALADIGVEALREDVMLQVFSKGQKRFGKYLDELRKSGQDFWKDSVIQLHGVLQAAAGGGDLSGFHAKRIRGGLIQVSLGASAHRVLIAAPTANLPATIVNWGIGKRGWVRQHTNPIYRRWRGNRGSA